MGRIPLAWGHERVDKSAQIDQSLDGKPWVWNKLVCRRQTRLGHPRRHKRQGLIGLSDDEVLGARVAP
jgi:hypothetical protein